MGQVLLAPLDFVHRQQYLHARQTLSRLLELGVVPVVNENDATSDDEIRFGDNDRLAALVAHLVAADLLVLLTDTAGLLTADPRTTAEASLIEEVVEVDHELEIVAGGAGSAVGSGGMASKLAAAKIAAWSGVETVIADAGRPGVLRGAVEGEPGVGTVFRPRARRLPARKLWIAFAVASAGTLVVDEGARRALVEREASLLPAGVVSVSGRFDADDAVEIAGPDGVVFAKGLARHPAQLVAVVGGAAHERAARRRGARGRAPRRSRGAGLRTRAGRRYPGAWPGRNIVELGRRAKAASRALAMASGAAKDAALRLAADLLEQRSAELLEHNAHRPRPGRADGATATQIDRLRLSPERIAAMADGLRQVAALPDPVGEVVEGWVRPNGLRVERVRVPLGVVGIIYENRPNVTSDAAGLCLKAGNATMLRGSSSAADSNAAIVDCLREALAKVGLPEDAVIIVADTSRSAAVRVHAARRRDRLPDPPRGPLPHRHRARARHGART